jgi:hypothetical protein
MILHIVLVKFRSDVTAAQRAALYADLAALKDRLPGMTGFAAGPNVSVEGIGRGYGNGFVVTFADTAARDAYLADEEHAAVGARLVAATEGGVDGLLVVDLDVRGA